MKIIQSLKKYVLALTGILIPLAARAQGEAGPPAPTLSDKMYNNIKFLGLNLRGSRTTDPPETIIGTVLAALFTFLAVIFFILIVWGGITWMTSAGNDDKVRKAKNLIIASVIGMGIVLTSYLITVFVISLFGG